MWFYGIASDGFVAKSLKGCFHSLKNDIDDVG